MGYYMSEHLICHYPRLPMDVLFAAQEAYVGPKALMTIAKEWGVEEAAEPGGEVDPGLLQFRQAPPGMDTFAPQGNPVSESQDDVNRANKDLARSEGWRKGMSSRIVYDDQFGIEHQPEQSVDGRIPVTSRDDAHAHFVRALMGALQLHTGRAATKKFFSNHFLSRVLNLSHLFDFRYPTRDLSRLCLREGFERPVARLISESGRHSAHPIFVVGVYSGRDKLGEAVGGNLEEAKNRAAAAALKGWYLYSPMEITVPSETEDSSSKAFTPNMVDPGEVIT
jgi:dsRNA-specific ribonuclease